MERAVKTLDGIPGWLSYFGYEYAKVRYPKILDQILNNAVELALNEIKKLENLSKLYTYVLKAVAMGFNRWSNIKRAVEAWLGYSIPNRSLSRILRNLEKMNILKSNDEYNFLDPVIREASKRI